MEQWKDVKGFEGLYQVSDLGRVKALERIDIFPCMFNGTKKGVRKERILSPRKHTNGYLRVAFGFGKRTDFFIHRLVCAAFHENVDNKSSVNHKNSIRSDNRADNLEWVTPKENTAHARVNGRLKHGHRITNRKLDEVQIKTIRSIGNNLTLKELSVYFDVSDTCIDYVIKRKTWVNV